MAWNWGLELRISIFKESIIFMRPIFHNPGLAIKLPSWLILKSFDPYRALSSLHFILFPLASPFFQFQNLFLEFYHQFLTILLFVSYYLAAGNYLVITFGFRNILEELKVDLKLVEVIVFKSILLRFGPRWVILKSKSFSICFRNILGVVA